MKKPLLLLVQLILCIPLFSQTPSAIRVERSGAGRPVIYLPGFTSPGSVWKETVRHLKGPREHHLVTYAGFGDLPAIDTPWYPRLRSELLAYIAKERLTDITIIGHSMGGTLAVDIAAALPDQVNGLILVDALPAMRALMMPGVDVHQITYNNPYNRQLLHMPPAAFQQMALSMARNMTADSTKIDTLVNWSVTADRKTFVYGYTDLMKLDLREDLKKIRARTLVLGAPFPSREAVLPNFESQYRNLAQKDIQIAPAGRHFLMFDQATWFFQKVNTFLFP